MSITDPLVRAARTTPAVGLKDTEGFQPNMRTLRQYRLERVRAALRVADVAGIVLYDPINIRYATGSRNMTLWTLHNAARYCFIPTEGPVILFEYRNSSHLVEGLEGIDELRLAKSWFFFAAGKRWQEKVVDWAEEISDLVNEHGGGNKRLLIDTCTVAGVNELTQRGIQVLEGQETMEMAREIKSPEEVLLMNYAISACEIGMARIDENLKPGVSEYDLWAELNDANNRLGGEWLETRLLSSGDRTNPWFQEASDRLVRPGEIVSYDTDLIGPFGYCADLSRTIFCGPGRPTDEQRRLFRLSWEQIQHNFDILKPGMSFKEISEKAWKIPESCNTLRYGSLFHGVGMCDEYPRIVHFDRFEADGYDGHLEPGMTFCVESYIAEEGGRSGIKLEDQFLVTESGMEMLSHYPFDEALLPREV